MASSNIRTGADYYSKVVRIVNCRGRGLVMACESHVRI